MAAIISLSSFSASVLMDVTVSHKKTHPHPVRQKPVKDAGGNMLQGCGDPVNRFCL